MVIMSAKFDEDAYNYLVPIMLKNMHGQTHTTTAVLLYPLYNVLCSDNKLRPCKQKRNR